ncbi:ribonuclease H-like [Scyliorhinus torazame]|uniref:ribonuclease H-like n=1 Tax=Scyliorhinus torazame TaxID=75743 RepID=UPI003B599887
MFIHNIKKGQKRNEPVNKTELVNAWVLYTDGSKVKEDEEQARWAFGLKYSGKKVVEKQGIIIGSAQTADVEGVLQGLKECQQRKLQEVTVVTDSFFVQQGLEKELKFWKLNGWMNGRNKLLEQKEQREEIDKILADMEIQIIHQKAHTKGTGELCKGNQEVDELARLRMIILGSLGTQRPTFKW